MQLVYLTQVIMLLCPISLWIYILFPLINFIVNCWPIRGVLIQKHSQGMNQVIQVNLAKFADVSFKNSLKTQSMSKASNSMEDQVEEQLEIFMNSCKRVTTISLRKKTMEIHSIIIRRMEVEIEVLVYNSKSLTKMVT